MRLTRATACRIVLLVMSAYFLLATSNEDPYMSSEQINEQLDISVGSPAQIRFEQAITGSDLEATVALRFDIPGADRDDVIVEILGEPPENVFISTSSATCSGCGDSVSVRFSLVPDSDIDFGTVFLHAVSEIRPDEWSETNGVLLELKRVAIEEADGVLVLAEAVREDDQRAWELSASPNVELEIISSSSLEVYGASDSRVLVGSQQRLQFDKCQACPERPIYLWGKGGDAVAWRLVTVDPEKALLGIGSPVELNRVLRR